MSWRATEIGEDGAEGVIESKIGNRLEKCEMRVGEKWKRSAKRWTSNRRHSVEASANDYRWSMMMMSGDKVTAHYYF